MHAKKHKKRISIEDSRNDGDIDKNGRIIDSLMPIFNS